MKSFISFLIFILLSPAFAATPTPEGLFRNSSNQEVTGEGVVVSYSVEEQENDAFLEKAEANVGVGALEDELSKKKQAPVFIKEVLWIPEKTSSPQAIKYIYNSSQMKVENMIGLKFFPNYKSTITSEENVNKRVLYSLMSMFLLNDSKIIGTLLSEKGKGFKNNKSLLDHEKLRLLEKYKKYLATIKKDKDLEGELESPLNPTDVDEKSRTSEVMKKNIYAKTDLVKLVKSNNEFLWRLDLGVVTADFSNEDHRLKKFNLQANGEIEVITGDYILFDGVHELPKVIFFKANNNRLYKVRFLKLKHYQGYKRNFFERQKKINELTQKIKENGAIKTEHPLLI